MIINFRRKTTMEELTLEKFEEASEIVKEVFHGRSEEHTSELQSQFRISYAVFCLKKKKKQNYAPSDG